jgi:phosphoenolpyruvate carboxykinase (GTP)
MFTNVALTEDGDVWWEGIGTEAPQHLTDWKGNLWSPEEDEPAAHPNARFTAPANQCPSMAPEWKDPEGVPISAILIGGSRKDTMPLVLESFSWDQGVLLGAVVGSDLTSAAILESEVRRDPFAMLPFCGYNICEYLKQWLALGDKIDHGKQPRIFYVNWFKRSKGKKCIWPGYGDNIRVLIWIVQRIMGTVNAEKTKIGFIPIRGALDASGLELSESDLNELFEYKIVEWLKELDSISDYFNWLGKRLPDMLEVELRAFEIMIAGY